MIALSQGFDPRSVQSYRVGVRRLFSACIIKSMGYLYMHPINAKMKNKPPPPSLDAYLVSLREPRQTTGHIPSPRAKEENGDSEDPVLIFLLPPRIPFLFLLLFGLYTLRILYFLPRKRYKLSNGPPGLPAHQTLLPPQTSLPLRQTQVRPWVSGPRPRPPGLHRPSTPQREKPRLARGFPGRQGPTIF